MRSINAPSSFLPIRSLRWKRFFDLDWLALLYLDGFVHRLVARERQPDIVLSRRQWKRERCLLPHIVSIHRDVRSGRRALDADVHVLFRAATAENLFQS